MTYNILNGGEAGIDKIIDTINAESPDFLTINEANTFADNNFAILYKISKETGLNYSYLAMSGEYDYHVAVFSKRKWSNVFEVHPLMRACVIAEFDTNIGKLSVGGLHLTPYTEDMRHPEIDLISDAQKNSDHKILMGDFNSLSKEDNYDQKIIKNFNELQIKKFTTENKLRFDIHDKIKSQGYIDSALVLQKNLEHTAPTSKNEYDAHSNMRLDYIYISKSLENRLVEYTVVKNKLTEIASDHYPVTVVLKDIEFTTN